MMEKSKNEDLTTTEQSNVSDHGKFEKFVMQGLKSGGVHIVANKSHGKSRLMFSMAKTLMGLENCRVIVFDGSETWLYAFSKIETFTVQDREEEYSSEHPEDPENADPSEFGL